MEAARTVAHDPQPQQPQPQPEAPAPGVPVGATTNAVALGWQIAELYQAPFSRRERADGAPPDRLPDADGLKGFQKTGLAICRLEARLVALRQVMAAAGQGEPDLKPLRDQYKENDHGSAGGRAAVYELHVAILQALSATDFRLGMAYGLGRALADSCLGPRCMQDVRREFGHGQLDTLRSSLTDLATALPDHSAKAVLQSLTSWEAWAANLPSFEEGSEASEVELRVILVTLERQGALWRSVLTGEKFGRDLLTDDDYVQAGRALASRTRSIALNLLKHIGLLPLAVVVAAIALAVVLIPGNVPQLATIAGSVAAALGFTWKAITDALKKAATRLERPLWGAELDAAVAVAVTYLPAVGPPAPDIQLLDKSPFFLRVLHVTGEATDGQGATREELTSALTATFDRNRREGSAGDKWALRVRRLRGARPDGDAITYWLAWAKAAGYVVALDDTHYDLSAEGERLAQIPRGQAGMARAALTAARPAAVVSAPRPEATRSRRPPAPPGQH